MAIPNDFELNLSDDDESIIKNDSNNRFKTSHRMVPIGNNRFVNVNYHCDEILIFIREFCLKNGVSIPKYPGISLNIKEWEFLKASTSILDGLVQDLKVSCEKIKKQKPNKPEIEKLTDVCDSDEIVSTKECKPPKDIKPIKKKPSREKMLQIGNQRFVNASVYKGNILIGISTLARTGISLKLCEWDTLKSSLNYIDEVINTLINTN